MNIVIVFSNSGRGLQKDADILNTALTTMGHNCQQIRLLPKGEWGNRASHYRFRLVNLIIPAGYQQSLYRCWLWLSNCFSVQPKADLVIHLQNIHPRYLRSNTQHWLIPNQEWFIPAMQPYLRFIDQVLCKTQHAANIFSQLHPTARYLGFTGSPAVAPPGALMKDFSTFLHVSGNSQLKGTESLVACWAKHPEWPNLVLVTGHLPVEPNSLPANIKHCKNISDKELISHWQQAGFAIIPSEVEGYGQVLAEAMSYGCVAITTNAPPMNELISEGRGILISAEEAGKFRLGTRYKVTQVGIEEAVHRALALDQTSLQLLSENAVQWHKSNHLAFEQRLNSFITNLPARG